MEEDRTYCTGMTTRGKRCAQPARTDGMCRRHYEMHKAGRNRHDGSTQERTEVMVKRWDLSSDAGRMSALQDVTDELKRGMDPATAQAHIAAIRVASRQKTGAGRTARPRVTFAVATTREQAEAINAQREERETAS